MKKIINNDSDSNKNGVNESCKREENLFTAQNRPFQTDNKTNGVSSYPEEIMHKEKK